MDEYSILRKKNKKNAFVATALLISIAIALLVMVGAILILSKVNDNEHVTAYDSGNTTETSTTEETTTDSKSLTCEGLVKEIVFNDNMTNIKEAAIAYFTNERLPQTVGDTEKITLESMIDKKLVRKVYDASANSCNASKSYVEVTKDNDEYIMKIYLSCSDIEDYIIVHLGCYDYCDKDVCEKKDEKTYEYEYKKTTSCTMSPWSDWGEWKLTREKTSNLKKEDTKVVTSSKDTSSTIDASKNVSYNCDNYPGYTKVGTSCVKNSTITDTKDATKNPDTYNCNKYPGYTLSGTKCILNTTKKDVKDADKDPATYNCNKYPGYTLSGKKCVKTTTTKDEKDATAEYSCKGYSGYDLVGKKCVKTTTSNVDAEPIYDTRQKTEYYTCYKQECTTKIVFKCPAGQGCGNYPETSCENVKKTCSRKVNEQYVSGYKCTDSTYTLTQDKDGKYYCTKTTKDTKDAKVSYNCDKYPGYDRDGKKCIKITTITDKKDAEKNPTTYNCKKYPGYDLVDNKCIKYVSTTDEQDAEKNPATYNCNRYPGYTLSGTKCVKTTPTADTKPATAVVTYTCPSGYTQNNTKCTIKGTTTVKTTYYRYATRSCTGGSTSIEWSESKNDTSLTSKGYKLTGNKRELIIK